MKKMECCEYGTLLLQYILEAFSAKLIGRNQGFVKKPEAAKNNDCGQTSRNN
jgi:hypothetical protein